MSDKELDICDNITTTVAGSINNGPDIIQVQNLEESATDPNWEI